MKLLRIIAAALLIAATFPAEATDYAECGTCGAHVSEWHWVSCGGEPFEICGECYAIWEE